MSKISELWETREIVRNENYLELTKNEQDENEFSEKEKCKLLGIPCSFGICSECDVTDWE